MPGYYSRSMAGQLPLTPPDSGSGYSYSSMHYSQDTYPSQQSASQCHQDNGYEYQQGYMQPPVAPGPPSYQFSQGSYHTTTSLPPIQNFYEPLGAPTLPPLRIHDQGPFADEYQRRLQEQQKAFTRESNKQTSKEEKATGGVSAKLDYDMEIMTDFVSEATQSIFQYQVQSHPSFRKWVHQVLSATRLPSATIVLSLHYLNDRVANWPRSVVAGENQIYRLLAVALILGSKFLDDNTFINKSWSDVTAIRVKELNKLEMEWLHLISYELHVDTISSSSLRAWYGAWEKYQHEQMSAAQLAPARLSPLDTNVHGHLSSRDRYSPYPTPYSASSTSSRMFDASFSGRSSQFSTPHSAVDPWTRNDYECDEYYTRSQRRYPSAYEFEETSRRVSEDRARQTAFQYGPSSQQAYYSGPSYVSGWEQASAWSNAHRYDCSCAGCAYQQHYRPYPVASAYAAQTVMG